MVLGGIFISAYLIGFSGAIMPGPMLGVAVDESLNRGFKAGPLLVLGHGILEFVLVSAMVLGLRDFFSNETVAGLIGLFGGAFLAWMGYGMIKSSINKSISLSGQEAVKSGKRRNLVLTGAIVSIMNPFFILWWASTGMEFIRQSYAIGLLGIMFFFIGHILADLTWYSVLSSAFSKGKKLISDRIYRWIILSLGIFILFFSVYFIKSGWSMLFGKA